MLICCKPIKGYNNFSTTFKTGNKIRTEHIFSSIIFNKNVTNVECHTIYYGVTISKKIVKKAVVRNRVKRLFRVSIRKLIKEFEVTNLVFIDSIVLSWQVGPKHPKEISLNNVMPAVKTILEQAFNIYKKKNKINQKQIVPNIKEK